MASDTVMRIRTYVLTSIIHKKMFMSTDFARIGNKTLLQKGVKRLIEYEKFRELLDEKNLTPYAVSKATGIPSTCLADWKSGRSKPKSDKLYILAKYFNVPMEYFFE